MSEQQSGADKSLAQQTSPYGYAYWEWVAREDPEYAKARVPLSELSVGEGKALAIKYREMVIIGILAFRGASQEGMLAHMSGPFSMVRPNASCSRLWSPPRCLAAARRLPQGCARSCSSTPRGHSRTGNCRHGGRRWNCPPAALPEAYTPEHSWQRRDAPEVRARLPFLSAYACLTRA